MHTIHKIYFFKVLPMTHTHTWRGQITSAPQSLFCRRTKNNDPTGKMEFIIQEQAQSGLQNTCKKAVVLQ